MKRIETEGLSHYSYIVGDGSDLAVIDPMRDIGVYMREARKAGMRIKHIFETHRNEDYVIGSMELAKKTGAKIYISAHEDGKNDPYLVFTGDCLFMGDLGRTDFYGRENLAKMTGLIYDSIFEKLMPLGDDVLIFPAHGPGSACGISMDDRPYSTLGYERRYNPVLQVSSKEELIDTFGYMRIKPEYFERMEVLNVEGAPFLGEEVILNALTVKEVKEMMDDILLVDVRTKEAYFGGHIPGSIYMSKSNISTFIGAIFSPDSKVLFAIDGDYMKPLGASTSFVKASGYLVKFVDKGKVAKNSYYQKNKPEIDWGMMLVFGIIIGAFIAAFLSGDFNFQKVPAMWTERFSDSFLLRFIVAFIGGAFLGVGSRWAGGCTSGHGISGTSQLSVLSWAAAGAFFAGGIAVAFMIFGLPG